MCLLIVSNNCLLLPQVLVDPATKSRLEQLADFYESTPALILLHAVRQGCVRQKCTANLRERSATPDDLLPPAPTVASRAALLAAPCSCGVDSSSHHGALPQNLH